MATVSFDEKVIITNPTIAKQMKRELESTSKPAVRSYDLSAVEDIEKDSERWAEELLHLKK